MKIIFFGSDDFAKVSLEALKASEHDVVACVTQPDKPKGRGMALTMPPIKEFAGRHDIPVFQPTNLKEVHVIESLKEFQSDLFVVIAYGRILPIEVLSIPYLCCMNVHGSLLPKYRGAAPINWAIINGDRETGVSIIKMNTHMDAGDIFAQTKIKIDPSDTAVSLRARMADLGARLLLKTIDSLEKNAYTLTVQDSAQVSLAPKLTKELGMIVWNKKAEDIHNLIRGLLPWPSAYTRYKGKMLKILEAEVLDADVSLKNFEPGEISSVDKAGFTVACADKGLLIKKVQPEAGKVMTVKDFLAGHKLKSGERLDNPSG